MHHDKHVASADASELAISPSVVLLCTMASRRRATIDSGLWLQMDLRGEL